MILAKGLRSRSALARLVLILTVAGLAAGCQSAARTVRPAVPVDGWRVIERLGEARYQAATGGGWSPAMPASTLEGGSRIATGPGGRLIVARPGQHISAGPASRFTLPDATPGAPLEQGAGWLRYRIAEPNPRRLVVLTPFLEVEVASTVFDVTVSTTATEVSVEQGRVRIATPDGLREIELGAGQSAYSGGASGAALAFRRTAAAPLEPVEAIVLLAMHPRPEMREGRPLPLDRGTHYAGSRASTSGAASSVAVVPMAKAEIANRLAATPAQPVAAPGVAPPQPSRAGSPAPPDAGAIPVRPTGERLAEDGRVVPPLSEAPRRAVVPQEPGEEASEALPPTAFDRLSEGMVNGLPGVLRAPTPAVDARRPF
jgi:hypothetical protein